VGADINDWGARRMGKGARKQREDEDVGEIAREGGGYLSPLLPCFW